MDSQTQTLLKKSAEDEQVLHLAGIPETLRGFHAQQAVEKLLKALLAEKRISYPWTHNLKELVRLLAEGGEKLPRTPIAITEFTPFATVWRYDNPPEDVLLDPEKSIETVRILREFVLRRVAELEKQQES